LTFGSPASWAGIKSGSIAQFLLQAGHERPLKIPCARETMQSIRESVHQLLEDQIQRLGLQGHCTVQKAEIIGRNGTSFTFNGLRDQSVRNIKSLEGQISCGSRKPRTSAKQAGER